MCKLKGILWRLLFVASFPFFALLLVVGFFPSALWVLLSWLWTGEGSDFLLCEFVFRAMDSMLDKTRG